MQIREITLRELLKADRQFRVATWQRRYVWTGKEQRLLWSDILAEYALRSTGAAGGGHFLGTVVLSPGASDVSSVLIVDGHQRMMTLLLLLAALRDAQAGETPQAGARIGALCRLDRGSAATTRLRLLPAEDDRTAFAKCMAGPDGAGADDRVSGAYRLFRSQLERADLGEAPLDLWLVEQVVLERLRIVEMTLGAGEDAHRIFETLNGAGVRLAPIDSLRSYLFTLLGSNGDAVYEQIWRPMELLVGVEHLECVARIDLQMRGIAVAGDDVYHLHRERLERIGADEHAAQDVVRDLARRARHLERILHPTHESDPELAAILARMARWGSETAYPLLTHGYDVLERGACTIAELREVAEHIEEFLVRRQLYGDSPDALNALFISLIEPPPWAAGFADGVRQGLAAAANDGVRLRGGRGEAVEGV